MKQKLKIFIKNYIDIVVIAICFLISLLVIFGWYSGNLNLIKFMSGSNIIKFNTALVILFIGINLFIFNKTNKLQSTVYMVLSVFLIFIGVFTLLQYIGFSFFNIDNLFVTDVFSKVNPGRMSPASAVCSTAIGIGFLGFKSKNKFISFISINSLILVSIITLIVIISYVLLIPEKNKTFIFKTVAVYTAVLFFSTSISLLLKKRNSFFNQMFKNQYLGTKIFRKTIPLIIIFPVVLANILLLSVKQHWISLDLGIVTYTVILIPISIMYISRLAIELNKTDLKRKKLEDHLINKNLRLLEFNKSLSSATILVVTDEKGIIKYVSDSFCEISQYSREEIVGNNHRIMKSGYHNAEFFENMWKTITAGKIFTGEIKNKTKDGSYYWAHSTIIPLKNKKDIITGFIAIRQNITERKERELLKEK